MPSMKRIRTSFPGVYYIVGTLYGKKEKIYYIRYRKKGRLIEEKVGRQFQDDMTASKASKIRVECLVGKRLSNKNIRRKQVEKTVRAKQSRIRKLKLEEI